VSARIVGLDVARGLAVMGMVAAHTGDTGASDGVGWPWLVAAGGRSSALFAVLAGASIALMLAHAGDDAAGARRTRAKVATRAGMLVLLGLLLTQLGTPVDIILVNLGLMMLMTLPVLRWPSWALLGLAATAIAFGTVLVEAVRPEGWWETMPVIGRLWSLHYPALSWIGYVLIGLVIGRLPLGRGSTQAMLVGLGAIVAGATVLVNLAAGDGDLTSLTAHSYSPAELAHNAGVAAAVIGLACWAAPRLRAVLYPVAALGSMALSAYVLHLLVIAAVGVEIVWEASNVSLVVLELTLLVLASLWRWRLGRGPLERVLTFVSSAAGDRAAAREAVRG